MSKLLTTTHAAERFGVDRRTIQRWAREQRIPHIRIGSRTIRFTESQLVEAITAYHVEKVEPRQNDASILNPAYTGHMRVIPMLTPGDAA
jgi:excisionase family DNA binding protein